MYRFLLTPRWLARIGLAMIGAVGFVALGAWQFDRARTVVAAVPAAQSGASARPLGTVLAGASTVTGATAGQLVTASGRFDAASQALVPDRVVDGRAGSWVVTPLRRPTGPAVLVVRGFVADGDAVPAVPLGPVTVTGWLAGSEPADAAVPTGAGQVGAVSGPLFVNRVSYPLVDGYLGSTRSTPASALVPVPLPGGGNATVRWSWQSLGYAVQWNLFAIGAFVVLIVAARQHAREGRAREVAQTGVREVTF